MSHFKAEMHQIRLRLGLRLRSRWGSLQRSPGSLVGFKGPTSKGREGKEMERRGRDVGRGREEEGREGKGVMERGVNGPPDFKTWMRQCHGVQQGLDSV